MVLLQASSLVPPRTPASRPRQLCTRSTSLPPGRFSLSMGEFDSTCVLLRALRVRRAALTMLRLGVFAVGSAVSLVLWGISCAQAWNYYSNYPKDSWIIKTIVRVDFSRCRSQLLTMLQGGGQLQCRQREPVFRSSNKCGLDVHKLRADSDETFSLHHAGHQLC
jgi:hypothetical protein